jgi:hypothetical protein
MKNPPCRDKASLEIFWLKDIKDRKMFGVRGKE